MRIPVISCVVLFLTSPGTWADTIELVNPAVSVNGKVSYGKDSFTIDLGGNKKLTYDVSNVKRVEFNAEAPSKKLPAVSGPIKRALTTPEWRVDLKTGVSKTGQLSLIDEQKVVLQGRDGTADEILRSHVAMITLVPK